MDRTRKRLEMFVRDPSLMGLDQIKKIIVYILMMKNGFPEEGFFRYLMQTPWYRETVDLFFDGEYRRVYDAVMAGFLEKKIVVMDDGRYKTTVTP